LVTQFQTTGDIDICKGSAEIKKKFVVIATALNNGKSLPYAQDNIDISTP